MLSPLTTLIAVFLLIFVQVLCMKYDREDASLVTPMIAAVFTILLIDLRAHQQQQKTNKLARRIEESDRRTESKAEEVKATVAQCNAETVKRVNSVAKDVAEVKEQTNGLLDHKLNQVKDAVVEAVKPVTGAAAAALLPPKN